MLMLSELSDADREERIQAWKNDGTVTVTSTASGRATKKVSYAESSSESEVEEKTESDFLENDSTDDDAEDDEDEDAIGSTDDEEEALGSSGKLFTPAEMRVLAKHIASVPGWFKGQRDWSGFVDKVIGSRDNFAEAVNTNTLLVHSTHSSIMAGILSKKTERSVCISYHFVRLYVTVSCLTKFRTVVDEAARKYMKRAKRAANSNSVHQQRGRPSWASTGSGRPPSSEEGPHKRKFVNEHSENGLKRARSDDTE